MVYECTGVYGYRSSTRNKDAGIVQGYTGT
jgi:hypothetical protein